MIHLGEQLTQEGSRKLFGQGAESKEDSKRPIEQLPELTQVLLKIIWLVRINDACIRRMVPDSFFLMIPRMLQVASLSLSHAAVQRTELP